MATEKPKRQAGQYIVLALLCTLFLAVVFPALIPVLMGLLISMVFRPIYLWMSGKLRQHTHLAAAISTLLIVTCVMLPLTLISIVVMQNTATLVKSVSDSIHNQQPGEVHILDIPAVSKIYEKVNSIMQISEHDFLEKLKQAAVIVVSFLTKFVGEFAASIPGKLLSAVFFLIAFYFGLIDGPAVAKFVRESLPFSEDETNEFFDTVSNISKGVILGTLTAGIVQGIIIGTAYWIFGIPKPFFFGSLTVIFSFIPLFGSLPTGLGAVVYLLIAHRYGAAIGMLVVFFLASISDNIVKPWILKGHSELHPLIGLISVLGGLQLFGFSGLFFGPLIAALTIAVIELTLQKRQHSEFTEPKSQKAH